MQILSLNKYLKKILSDVYLLLHCGGVEGEGAEVHSAITDVVTGRVLGESHEDTHLLCDRGDTCSTSATWSYRQQDLEEKDQRMNE